jgi:hypothetical protein
MASFKRAIFTCGDPGYNLTIDLLIRDNRKRFADLPTAGWWGKLGTQDIWPFVIAKDGQCDFGQDSDNPITYKQRYGEFHLNDRLLVPGETFLFTYHGERYDFVLEQLVDVLDKITD